MAGAEKPAEARSENLALLFQEILTAVVRIRAGRESVSDPESFRAQLRGALGAADAESRRRGYSADEARLSVLAVVAFVDESVLNSANPIFRDWPRRPLQEELFGGHVAGETFFQNLKYLLTQNDAGRIADVLEVYLLCLLLGYRGRYSAGREGDLQAVGDRIAEKIRRIRGATAAITTAYVPPVENLPRDSDAWVKGLLYGVAGLLVLALVLFLGYKLSISSALSDLHAAMGALAGGRA